MKFAYPEFLYALFAIAIPIVIHLFNFRKFKKIYFSNVEFLKEVQQETVFSGINKININSLPKGYYSVFISNSSGFVATKKLIITS